VVFIAILTTVQQETGAAPCPCDIYAAGGTPCIAAHSMVRALYETYSGPLYQVRLKSDTGKKKDIFPLTPGGYVNAAVQDSFLAGKPGTISILYDQSPKGNHLTRSPIGGWLFSPSPEVNAADTSIKINGHKVYGFYTRRGMGYRNNQAKGIATGNQAEGMYMVASGKVLNDSCCYDYGNAETNMQNNGTGTMEAIYLGKFCWFGPCAGTGPWVFADLENGLFTGAADAPNRPNPNNTSVAYDFVTAMLKGNSTSFSIRAGNAQSGTLKTMANNAPRPAPNKLEGAIILGVGGDNSWAAHGVFFEGAMTIGRPPDSTEDAVQRNIVAAGYGNPTVSAWHGAGTYREIAGASFAVCYNPSSMLAKLSYTLQGPRHVSVNVYDQKGRRRAAVVNGAVAPGRHEAVWDARRVPAGVYVWRASIDEKEAWTGKIVTGK
jgi:hypothetical protein